MKALTLWPEWAWAVCNLDKDVENRTYRPPKGIVGQRIAIHAGKRIGGKYVRDSKMAISCYETMASKASEAGWYPEIFDKYILFKYNKTIYGGYERLLFDEFDGVVMGCVVATAIVGSISRLKQGEIEPWAAYGQYQWHLLDVHVLKDPVICSGNQRLWTLPDDVEKKVVEQGG